MTVAIVDYGSGNLHSAEKSFQRMSRETTGETVLVTADAEAVRKKSSVTPPPRVSAVFGQAAASSGVAPRFAEFAS